MANLVSNVVPGDISTAWNVALAAGDWVLNGPQLQSGSDLETAVLISVFTDRQAEAGDVIPDGTSDRRGWWGDAGELYPIGSRIWLLARAKQTTQTLNLANDYLVEALQWMIDDGVVASFNISTYWVAPGTLGAVVTANQPGGSNETMQFSWTWSGIN